MDSDANVFVIALVLSAVFLMVMVIGIGGIRMQEKKLLGSVNRILMMALDLPIVRFFPFFNFVLFTVLFSLIFQHAVAFAFSSYPFCSSFLRMFSPLIIALSPTSLLLFWLSSLFVDKSSPELMRSRITLKTVTLRNVIFFRFFLLAVFIQCSFVTVVGGRMLAIEIPTAEGKFEWTEDKNKNTLLLFARLPQIDLQATLFLVIGVVAALWSVSTLIDTFIRIRIHAKKD